MLNTEFFAESLITIFNYFIRQEEGFFLESGALDGETRSNTLFFERFRGWRGLLIEADHNTAILHICIMASICHVAISYRPQYKYHSSPVVLAAPLFPQWHNGTSKCYFAIEKSL